MFLIDTIMITLSILVLFIILTHNLIYDVLDSWFVDDGKKLANTALDAIQFKHLSQTVHLPTVKEMRNARQDPVADRIEQNNPIAGYVYLHSEGKLYAVIQHKQQLPFYSRGRKVSYILARDKNNLELENWCKTYLNRDTTWGIVPNSYAGIKPAVVDYLTIYQHRNKYERRS